MNKAIFGILWCNFEKSDCEDTVSASFLCKKGPVFFVSFDFPERKGKH